MTERHNKSEQIPSDFNKMLDTLAESISHYEMELLYTFHHVGLSFFFELASVQFSRSVVSDSLRPHES